MTTPADNTPRAILYDAYGDELGGEQTASGMRRLRELVSLWQTQGIKLWLLSDTAVTITAGKATYTFMPSGDVDMTKPLRVVQGYFLYTSNNVRRPLNVLSWNDYLSLGQAGTLAVNQGPINSYFVNKLATELDVTFWLCPDSAEVTNGKPHVLLQTQVTNPISVAETMNFPQEWRIALHWGVAAEICTGQPQSVIQRCEQKAMMYRDMLENWDVEDAPTSFQPDPRMGTVSRFR